MYFCIAKPDIACIILAPPRWDTKDAAMHGSIAQLVEQQIENLRVAGSIPARATFLNHVFRLALFAN